MDLGRISKAELHGIIAVQQARVLRLSEKIGQLNAAPSTDPVQQLQTETIIELYDTMKRMQDAIWPLLANLPDTDAVREAAAAGAAKDNGLLLPAVKSAAIQRGKFFS